MKQTIGVIGVFTLAVMLASCGGNGGGSAGEQTMNYGPFTSRAVGTAQPPVTLGGSGSVITGVAGATFSSIVLNSSSANLAQTKIAFASNVSGDGEIWTMNVDGGAQTNLTKYPGDDTSPSWSPDGTQIVFSSDRLGPYRLYTMNSDGSNQVRHTTGAYEVNDADPSWSPDGNWIAFSSNRLDGNFSIYKMLLADGSITRLTNGSTYDQGPAWSPDGKRIAYSSDNGGGTREIWLMDSDGSNKKQLTNSGGENLAPAWSPDGSRIAFESHRDNTWEVYIMNAGGGNQKNLSRNSADDLWPAWSPDGSSIAFGSDRQDATTIYTTQLYLMSPDGLNQTKLPVVATGNSQLPRFSPFVHKRTLLGTGGSVGAAAAGFLFGQNGDIVTSVVTFDTPTATRSSARVAAQALTNPNQPNLIFTVTPADSLTSLAYTNDFFQKPTVVIGAGGDVTNASAALVSFNAAKGTVALVLPYNANRSAGSAPITKTEGDVQVFQGSFVGAWDRAGKNCAKGGAREVRLNVKTGEIVTVR